MSQTHRSFVPRPTMSDLISMKMRDGSEEKLEIIRWISSHTSTKCDDFAHKLLNNRLTVRELQKKHSKDDEFVRAVLDKWVSRDDDSKKGSLPCTWDTLVQCVDESGLDGDFLKLLKDNVPTGTPIIPESPSPSLPSTKKHKSQPTDPVTSYAQYLKYRYRQPLPDERKLLTTPSKYYIELAVINSEGISTRENADEFTRKTLHGLTEEIMCKKTPIALENILKPGEDGKPVRCVLVEGAPGAGKSTLAWELCHKWEELECTKHYDLVVLVQLREKRAQEATHLNHLFPKSESNMDDILALIGNGQGVLVVLDGFDELPREQREENSVYIKLIKGVDLLPEATVVITSRPSVSADFLGLCRHNINRHLEVLGFTPEQIEKYAASVFRDGEELKSFIQYINSNPAIKGMMYLPLNAVIVASVFKYSNGRYSKTMTQLYDALTRILIRRYLAEKEMVSSDYRMPDTLLSRESISKLPIKVAEQLVVVARVAYMGLCEEKYVFTDLRVKFDNLGMMKKTTSLDMFGPTCSFSFLHLTLQEYLSALYISLELHSGLKVPPSVRKKKIVIRFLAGLCEHGNHNVYQTLGFFLQVDDFDYSLLVVQCVYECDSIVQNIKELQELFVGDKLISVMQCLPFDCYLVGHCISHIGGRWSIGIWQQEEVDLLIQGLGSYDTCSRGKIQELRLRGNALLKFDPLVKLCCHDLHSLVLNGIRCTERDAALLREYISPGRVLKVFEMFMCHNVEPMLPIVFCASSLHSLALHTNIPNKINTSTLNLLNDNSNLKEIRMVVFKFDVFEQLAAALYNNTSLILFSVDLSHCKPVDCVPVLIKLLQSNHTLQEVEVLTFKLYQGDIDSMVQLVEVAANSTSLKKLSCDKRVYEQLQSRVPKQYQYILHETN